MERVGKIDHVMFVLLLQVNLVETARYNLQLERMTILSIS